MATNPDRDEKPSLAQRIDSRSRLVALLALAAGLVALAPFPAGPIGAAIIALVASETRRK